MSLRNKLARRGREGRVQKEDAICRYCVKSCIERDWDSDVKKKRGL